MFKFLIKGGLSGIVALVLCMMFGQFDVRAFLALAFAIFIMLSLASRRPK